MKYIVKVSNGASYSPDYPYEGTDKDVATAIAAAYIARGKKVFVFERETPEQNTSSLKQSQMNIKED